MGVFTYRGRTPKLWNLELISKLLALLPILPFGGLEGRGGKVRKKERERQRGRERERGFCFRMQTNPLWGEAGKVSTSPFCDVNKWVQGDKSMSPDVSIFSLLFIYPLTQVPVLFSQEALGKYLWSLVSRKLPCLVLFHLITHWYLVLFLLWKMRQGYKT